MPGGVAAALAAAAVQAGRLDAEIAGSCHQAGPIAGARAGQLPTSFYNVECAQGFVCVSKVSKFDMGHNGNITLDAQNGAGDSKFLERWESSYEVGCPARGQMTAAGDCKDDGAGVRHMCWSPTRYEASDASEDPLGDSAKAGTKVKLCQEENDCFCVKDPATVGHESSEQLAAGGPGVLEKPNGTGSPVSQELVQGKESQLGMYKIQKAAQCKHCSQHDCDPHKCNACEHCTFVQSGEDKGCSESDKGAALIERRTAKDGRLWLPRVWLLPGDKGGSESSSLTPKELETKGVVIYPHYKMWDPKDTEDTLDIPPRITRSGSDPEDDRSDYGRSVGTLVELKNRSRWPYESHRQGVSRSDWIEKYKKVAPTIQLLMDRLVTAAITDWKPAAHRMECNSLDGNDADIAGKIEKVKAVQSACLDVQDLASNIAPGLVFNKTVSAAGHDHTLKCVRTTGDCEQLNCYTSDRDLRESIRELEDRNSLCSAAADLLYDANEAVMTRATLSSDLANAGNAPSQPEGAPQPDGGAPPPGGAAPPAEEAAQPPGGGVVNATMLPVLAPAVALAPVWGQSARTSRTPCYTCSRPVRRTSTAALHGFLCSVDEGVPRR